MSFRFVFICIFVLWAGTHTARAEGVSVSAWCTLPSAPVVHVGLQASDPKGNYTLSMAQLEKFPIDTKSPYEAHIETHVGGLTDGGIQVTQQFAFGESQMGEQICLWIKRVDIVIKLDQTVYVASEYPAGSCRFKMIWEHEHKHVRVDREIMNQYRPEIEAAVREAVAQNSIIGPISASDQKTAQEKLALVIREAVTAASERMDGDRKARQQAIDSREEYDRVSNACPERK